MEEGSGAAALLCTGRHGVRMLTRGWKCGYIMFLYTIYLIHHIIILVKSSCVN
jgi:hypothetical protein